MVGLKDRIGKELDELVEDGGRLLGMIEQKKPQAFATGYQHWYTRALPVVHCLIPDRELDFRRLYARDPRRKDLNAETYTLEDYVQGLAPARFYALLDIPLDIHAAAASKFANQVMILDSAASRLSDILANIRGLLQADLFDSELDAARDLKKNGHLRAAGAVAGVVLEGHLKELCARRGISVKKKNPGIADFNDALKDAGVLDIPEWRRIQALADIRNLCDHKKDREPTADEVAELIDGVGKAVKTLA